MRLFKAFKTIFRRESGQTLVEMLVALTILGITAVAFSNGLNSASAITFSEDQRESAKNLAEIQMDYIKDQYYAASYDPSPIPDEYKYYSANISVNYLDSRDGNIQKITVIIKFQDKEVTRLEGYKVN